MNPFGFSMSSDDEARKSAQISKLDDGYIIEWVSFPTVKPVDTEALIAALPESVRDVAKTWMAMFLPAITPRPMPISHQKLFVSLDAACEWIKAHLT